MMTDRRLHHLVVVQPESKAIVGILSALDIVLSGRPATPVQHPLLAARRTLHSPVAEFVKKEDTPACSIDCTLGNVGDLLASRSCCATLIVDGEGAMKGVVTLSDILQAYLDGWGREDGVARWLEGDEPRLPRHVLVRPVVPLAEVATMMLMTHEHVGGCDQLLVCGEGGDFHGVLSSLDVAEALHELGSVEDAAVCGAPATVAMVAELSLELGQPAAGTCRPSDTLRHVFGSLARSKRDAVLVTGEGGTRAVVTPRAALQAFNEGLPLDAEVSVLLGGEGARLGPREVAPTTPLLEAAALMVAKSLHHLVVVASPGAEPMGLLSSLDVVRGAASVVCSCRFVSLRWLRSCRWAARSGGS